MSPPAFMLKARRGDEFAPTVSFCFTLSLKGKTKQNGGGNSQTGSPYSLRHSAP